MNYDNVKLAVSDYAAVITISRQSALNALNSAVMAELGAALAEVRAHKDCRVLIITGEGEKAFVAGADIAEMRDLGPDEAADFARRAVARAGGLRERLLHRADHDRLVDQRLARDRVGDLKQFQLVGADRHGFSSSSL